MERLKRAVEPFGIYVLLFSGISAFDLESAVSADFQRNGPNDPDQAELLLLRSRIFERSGAARSALAECRRALSLQRRISAEPAIIEGTAKSCASLETGRDRLVVNQ